MGHDSAGFIDHVTKDAGFGRGNYIQFAFEFTVRVARFALRFYVIAFDGLTY